MIAKQAEAELELAMLENTSTGIPNDGLSIDEKTSFLNEINALKSEIEAAKKEYSNTSSRTPEMARLQDELGQAVADSFELQMELEQTQERIRKMEKVAALDPTRETIESISRQAEEAQSKAEARIGELTSALKN